MWYIRIGWVLSLKIVENSTEGEEFAKLLPFSTGKSTLDSDPLAEYLKTSGLPRKVLKQIWIASVKSATQADFDDFACCCRLIAHCQIALANGDAATIEVMEQAGEQLRQLLREKFLDKSPAKMPEFGKTWCRPDFGDCKSSLKGGIVHHCALMCIVHNTFTRDIREVGFLHPSGVDTLLALLDAIVLSQNAEENRFRSALGGGDKEFLYKQYQTGVVTCDIYERFWVLSVCLLFDSDLPCHEETQLRELQALKKMQACKRRFDARQHAGFRIMATLS